MSLEHLSNVATFLLENVEYFYVVYLQRTVAQMVGDLLQSIVPGEVLAVVVGGPQLTDSTPGDLRMPAVRTPIRR